MPDSYGIKFDPPQQAISLPAKSTSSYRAPQVHTLVGYSRRGYGAFVERGRYGDVSVGHALYEYDETVAAEIAALVSERDAVYAQHLGSIDARLREAIE